MNNIRFNPYKWAFPLSLAYDAYYTAEIVDNEHFKFSEKPSEIILKIGVLCIEIIIVLKRYENY